MCRQSCGWEAATGGDDAGRAGSGSYCLLLSDVRAARGCAVGCLVRPQLSRLRSVCSGGEAECGSDYSDSSAQSARQQQLQWNGPNEVGKLFYIVFFWVLSGPEVILRLPHSNYI